MENKTNPKNAAFANLISSNGCTKREYFAAMAMQGLLTRVPKRQGGETDLGILEAKRIAAESRIIADLLIEELNEGGENE
jgi:Mn-dependent DtxR family transcriptional regulator